MWRQPQSLRVPLPPRRRCCCRMRPSPSFGNRSDSPNLIRNHRPDHRPVCPIQTGPSGQKRRRPSMDKRQAALQAIMFSGLRIICLFTICISYIMHLPTSLLLPCAHDWYYLFERDINIIKPNKLKNTATRHTLLTTTWNTHALRIDQHVLRSTDSGPASHP